MVLIHQVVPTPVNSALSVGHIIVSRKSGTVCIVGRIHVMPHVMAMAKSVIVRVPHVLAVPRTRDVVAPIVPMAMVDVLAQRRPVNSVTTATMAIIVVVSAIRTPGATTGTAHPAMCMKAMFAVTMAKARGCVLTNGCCDSED